MAFAKSEALQNGYDEAIMLTNEGHVSEGSAENILRAALGDEAIMLTNEGHVSEGSAENIFLVINGELITPSPSENILLGITRDTVIELARRELGLITRERQIDRTELYTADENFRCGTGAQIAPVIPVDH